MIGDDIRITICEVRGKQVRLGLEAPRHIKMVRGELLEQNRKKDTPQDQETPS